MRCGSYETGCVGSCDLGPLALVYPEGIFYQKLKPADADEIVGQHLLKGRVVERLLYKEPISAAVIPALKDLSFFRNQEKIVLRNCGVINPLNIEEYIARDGYQALGKVLTSMTQDEVIDEVLKSGLRGRGGAGFPTGLKWKFTKQSPGDRKYVVCNADEGDPGAFMDRSVLEGDPHSVIEAMTIAGYTVGANQGYVYVRAEYPLAIERSTWAIDQARKFKFLGKNIFETGFDFDLDIRIGAGAFVCGEETALMFSIEGKRGEPRPETALPGVRGLFNAPTLLNNVETYANIAAIILKGAEWYARFGTRRARARRSSPSPATVNNTGLVEVPMGTPLGELVYNIGGGIKKGKKFKAAQTRRPVGRLYPVAAPEYAHRLRIASRARRHHGLRRSDRHGRRHLHGRLRPVLRGFHPGRIVRQVRPPCRIGTKRMLEILQPDHPWRREGGRHRALIELGERIRDAALCGLGQTAPNPVLSTLRFFKHEYEEHIKDHYCRAGVCSSLFDAPCQNACPAERQRAGLRGPHRRGPSRRPTICVRQENPFPAICGRVCTHPCEGQVPPRPG